MGHCKAHPTHLTGGTAGPAGIALPSIAPVGAAGLDKGLLGRNRRRPQGQILLADTRRAYAASERVYQLGSAVECDQSRHSETRGVTQCAVRTEYGCDYAMYPPTQG